MAAGPSHPVFDPDVDRPRPEPSGPSLRAHLEHAVELALRAPSLHNTQPWRWRVEDGRVDLFADPGRHLPGTDPDRRDLLISCGAALHHLCVALAGFGTACDTAYLPDAEDRDHLATVRTRPGRPVTMDAALYAAIGRRRSDRRPYLPDSVPVSTLEALRFRAARFGVTLLPVLHPAVRGRMDTLLADAAAAQRHRPGYLAELLTWTHRFAGAHDGVPASSRPHRPDPRTDPTQRFPSGVLRTTGSAPDGSVLLVLLTAHDDDAARLAAGEAASAVLLGATASGLASATLSQPLDMAGTRRRLARDVLRTPDHPQLILRVGRAPDDTALPETPRRPLSAVLLP